MRSQSPPSTRSFQGFEWLALLLVIGLLARGVVVVLVMLPPGTEGVAWLPTLRWSRRSGRPASKAPPPHSGRRPGPAGCEVGYPISEDEWARLFAVFGPQALRRAPSSCRAATGRCCDGCAADGVSARCPGVS